MRYLNFLVLLTLISCGSSETKKEFDPSFTYTTSGVEQFFLPELPAWANYSAPGACFKSRSFYYMDFKRLNDAYQLTYAQMVELQAQYNERLENYFRSIELRFVKPVEEASFFSNSLEQVRGGVRSLKLPLVSEVEVIWLEAFTPAELKKLAKSVRFNEKLPILFSSCLSKQALTQWLMQEQMEDVGFYLLSAEWLSPFDSQGVPQAGLKIHLAKLLGEKIKITLTTNNKTTPELVVP